MLLSRPNRNFREFERATFFAFVLLSTAPLRVNRRGILGRRALPYPLWRRRRGAISLPVEPLCISFLFYYAFADKEVQLLGLCREHPALHNIAARVLRQPSCNRRPGNSISFRRRPCPTSPRPRQRRLAASIEFAMPEPIIGIVINAESPISA